MHITELKKEVDALREGLDALVKQTAEKVLVSALNEFNDRITALEQRATEAGI